MPVERSKRKEERQERKKKISQEKNDDDSKETHGQLVFLSFSYLIIGDGAICARSGGVNVFFSNLTVVTTVLGCGAERLRLAVSAHVAIRL